MIKRYTTKQFKTKLNKIYCCDCLKALKALPDKCIDMVITSPPYWSLRDYSTSNQIWDSNKDCKHNWIKYIKRPSGGKGSKCANVGANKNDFANMRDHNIVTNFCSKCNAWRGSLGLEPIYELYIKHLCDILDEAKRILKKTGTAWINIGDTYAANTKSRTMKMGNPEFNKNHPCREKTICPPKKTNVQQKSLIGIPERFVLEMQNRGWIRRNTIIWQKPNAMPSSCRDRFTVDFEYLYFFVKNKEYYFQQQFEPYTKPMNRWGGEKLKANGKSLWDNGTGQTTYRERNMRPNPKGKNKRCVWSISTKPLKKSNFAPYPEKLIETPIKAGCPKNGVVLDPFIGTGTTALVAGKLDRNFIGFELKPEYCKIAEERLKNASS